MAKKLIFNILSSEFDYIDDGINGNSTITIPQLNADPASPNAEDAWVLRSPIYSAGTPLGLLLAITNTSIVGYTYQHSYRTKEGTTVRVSLT